jgi:hypothetical protein
MSLYLTTAQAESALTALGLPTTGNPQAAVADALQLLQYVAQNPAQDDASLAAWAVAWRPTASERLSLSVAVLKAAGALVTFPDTWGAILPSAVTS